MAGVRMRLADRLEGKIMPVPFAGCWLWMGECDPRGYGRFYEWNNGRSKSKLAHRIVYEHERGPIPPGLCLDHLCRNPSCVNPDHLEAVTHAENMARGAHAMKTHCKNSHPLSGENLTIRIRRGRKCRTCRECNRQRVAQFHERNPGYNTRTARRQRGA